MKHPGSSDIAASGVTNGSGSRRGSGAPNEADEAPRAAGGKGAPLEREAARTAPGKAGQGAEESRQSAGSSLDRIGDDAGHLGVRLVHVLILAVCYFVLEIVVKAVTVLQFLHCLWKKRPHQGMQRLGAMIADYMQELWLYLTFASNHAPWPFNDWPRH